MTGTAVAAAAMAALTASQGPGVELVQQPGGRDTAASPSPDVPADGNSPYHTELPPLVKPDEPDASNDLPDVVGPTESGIPATVLAAYKKAERALRDERPGCNLPWQLLAAIGKVESGQARGGAVDSEGTTLKPILGPPLNGVGFAHISDTDNGAYDGDTRYDRAVGPMQFIPSTWAGWGADGNGDGREDPNNIYDATLAAGRYLCAGGRDLSKRADLEQAILSYNQSREYLRTVLSWLEFYRKGVHEVPDGEGVLPESPGAGNESRPAKPSAEPVTDSTTRPGSGAGGAKDDADGKGKNGQGEGDRTPSPQPSVSVGGTISPRPPSGSPGTGTQTPEPPGSEEPEEPGEEPEEPGEEPEEPGEEPEEPGEEPEEPGEEPEEPGEEPEEPGEEPEEPGEEPEEPGEEPEEPGEEPEEPGEEPEPTPTCPAEPDEPSPSPSETEVPAPSETPTATPSPTPTGDPEPGEEPEESEESEEPCEEPEDESTEDESTEDESTEDERQEERDGEGERDGTPAPSVEATVHGRPED
ncbi:lytic transglycosylase domain-containing protein [Streptomyces taklimakanensis]|uniref:lytic transglycosylase domain-containing protein n=1 Tax=Streptomyces taklimakanensis TaxID=2569853 RepID=UPI00308406DC